MHLTSHRRRIECVGLQTIFKRRTNELQCRPVCSRQYSIGRSTAANCISRLISFMRTFRSMLNRQHVAAGQAICLCQTGQCKFLLVVAADLTRIETASRRAAISQFFTIPLLLLSTIDCSLGGTRPATIRAALPPPLCDARNKNQEQEEMRQEWCT